jgi:hypothetical protein
MADDKIVMLRAKRPLSVWIVCLANGILAVFVIGSTIKLRGHGYPGGMIANGMLSAIAITLAAHATWYGYRYGRLALLGILTWYLGLVVVQSVMTIAGAAPVTSVTADWLRIGISLIWLGANAAVLYSPKARAFFG